MDTAVASPVAVAKIPLAIFLRWALIYPALIEIVGMMATGKGKASKKTVKEFVAASLDQLAELRQGGAAAVDDAANHSEAEIAELQSSLLICLQCRSDHLGRLICCDENFVVAAKEFLEEKVMPEVDATVGYEAKEEEAILVTSDGSDGAAEIASVINRAAEAVNDSPTLAEPATAEGAAECPKAAKEKIEQSELAAATML